MMMSEQDVKKTFAGRKKERRRRRLSPCHHLIIRIRCKYRSRDQDTGVDEDDEGRERKADRQAPGS